MKISIIGSAPWGSLFGEPGLLRHEVVLYDVYKDHVDAINRDGLAIEDAATGAVKCGQAQGFRQTPRLLGIRM
jgi:ketopantoate reductase